MTEMRIEVRKSQRGWSYTTRVKYPDWPKEVATSGGRSTKKSALWHAVFDCLALDAKLVLVTVKGKNMPFDVLWKVVHDALSQGPLAYRLPEIKKLLKKED